MARTDALKEGRRRRTGTVCEFRSARVAKALRLLARNSNRMHFSADSAAWDKFWRAIARFGIDAEVLAGLRDRHRRRTR